MSNSPQSQRIPFGLACIVVWAAWSSAFAQSDETGLPSFFSDPTLRRQFTLAISGGLSDGSDDGAGRANRIRLFHMPTGFMSDPVGLDLDDDTVGTPGDGDDPAGGAGRWGLSLGADNPYFDFRLPGDPGGVGFYKAHTQYQLYDSDSAHFSFNLQAATPAGLDNQGANGGPTVITPALAYFYEMESGSAVQAFVGKHFGARSGWSDSLERSVNYGLAVQYPLSSGPLDNAQNVYIFFEAIGNSHLVTYSGQSPTSCWRMVPGLHWRLTDNCWMSGGVLVPINDVDTGSVQLTCSWRF